MDYQYEGGLAAAQAEVKSAKEYMTRGGHIGSISQNRPTEPSRDSDQLLASIEESAAQIDNRLATLLDRTGCERAISDACGPVGLTQQVSLLSRLRRLDNRLRDALGSLSTIETAI